MLKTIVFIVMFVLGAAVHADQFDARDVRQVVIAGDGTIFASASPGMFKSADHGKSWARLPTVGEAYGDLVVTPQGTIFVMASGFVLKSTDMGLTFTEMGNASQSDRFLRPSSISYAHGMLFADFEGLLNSTDEGKTWHYSTKQFGGGQILAGPDGTLYFGNDGVIASSDKGRTWKRLSLNQEVRSLALTSKGTIFAGVNADSMDDVTYIWASHDKGKSWKKFNRGLPDRFGTTVHAIFEASNGMTFAAVNGKIFRMHKNGRGWADQSVGLPGTSQCVLKGNIYSGIYSIAEAPNGELYVGTRHGVFVSHNMGEIWMPSLILNTGF